MGKTRPAGVDAPFAPGVEKQAASIGARYSIVIEPQNGREFRARTLELPYVVGFGRSERDAIRDLRESLTLAVGSMLEQGVTPPQPASSGKRDDQVNIKLTKFEKAFFNEAARREGFRSVADFMRSLAMRRLR